MTDDDELRRFDEAMARLGAIADAEQHVLLEQTAASSPDHAWPPAPNTAHPWMADKAEFVRQVMARGEYQVLLSAPRKPLYRFISEPEPDVSAESPELLVLDVRRAAGAAPWTGDPFIWRWKVAVDKYGRWVAGDSVAQPFGPRRRP